MNALSFVLEVHQVCKFVGNEKPGKATNSEIRRWLQDSSIIINGTRPKPFDELTFPITQLILFPRGKRKCTIK